MDWLKTSSQKSLHNKPSQEQSYFILEDSNTAQQGSNFEDDVHDPDVVHPDKHIKASCVFNKL